MSNEKKTGSMWTTVLAIFLGGILTLASTVVTYLWLIPSQEKKMRQFELAELKVSKLYQPILIATGYGNLSLKSDITFHKVRRIMEAYSYLADKAFTDTYIEFLKTCRFVTLTEMLGGKDTPVFLEFPDGPREAKIPANVLTEMVRRDHLPLDWSSKSRLEDADAAEKKFQAALATYYQKAYEEFMAY